MVYFQGKHLLTSVASLFALVASLTFCRVVLAHPSAPMIVAWYGVNGTDSVYMSTATQYWPQQGSNWCGIANIQAIELFDWAKYGGGASNAPQPTQQDILSLLNATGQNRTPDAVSPWGTAIPSGGHSPFVKADIADDGGTDPRSISWAIWYVTPNGLYFHNYIYSENNLQATANFAFDFGAQGLNNPISVAINQGAHSFIIDGVYATEDPSEHNGAGVTAVDTWDPLVGSHFPNDAPYNSTQEETWSLQDWTNLQVGNGGFLWAYLYSNSANGGYDPDPNTNPGFYNPSPSHWNGNYVTDEGDTVTACNASPDLAYDQNGNQVAHHGTYCP